MSAKLPAWIIFVLVLQGLIALLVFAAGWSHTSSLTMGRTPPLIDLAFLAAPLIAVVLCAGGSLWAWRRDQAVNARLIAFLPFPVALLLFGIIGAI